MKLLSFGAVWCTNCLVMKPRLQEIEKDLSDLEIIYYDYDENSVEVEKWEVKDVLPTFILIDDEEKEIKRILGEKSKDSLIKIIKECGN